MAKNLIPGDTTIKAVKPATRARLNDGQGLYLLLFVKGGAHGWRFDYSIGGRRKTLVLGTYPDTSLKLARQKADDFRSWWPKGPTPATRARPPRPSSASKPKNKPEGGATPACRRPAASSPWRANG